MGAPANLEKVHAALTAYALSGENAREASRILDAQGFKVAESTIRTWARGTHRDLYEQIRREASSEIEAKLLPAMVETTAELHDLAKEGVEILAKLLRHRYTCNTCDYSCERPARKDDMACPQCKMGKLKFNRHEPDKLARMIKDTVSAFGTMQDKTRVRQMQPTEIVQVDNGDAELRRLLSDPVFAGLMVEGEAVEITPALTEAP